MQGSFPLLEIVLFAMVAGFLILRLRSVLGRRTGNERRRRDPVSKRGEADQRDKVVALPERPRPQARDTAETGEAATGEGVTDMRSVDPDFDPDGFLAGAKAAFEMVVQAFAQGDAAALRPLLSDEVYRQFEGAIRTRQAARQTLETTLVSIRDADIVEARMEDRNALVTVKFVSEQINVTRDSENRVVDGDPAAVSVVTDLWTFARDTRSRDPNWVLVATRSPT